jgi:cytochrome P450
VGKTATAVIRTTTKQTTVLGHSIPKGTELYILTTGPGYEMAPFGIDEEARSQSSRNHKDRIRYWNLDDSADFKPERWLSEKDGEEVFDASLGPQMVFGLGARGCYGRRLAYMELRLLLVLLVWHFELQPVGTELSGYKAVDKVTREPQQCYFRLADTELG